MLLLKTRETSVDRVDTKKKKAFRRTNQSSYDKYLAHKKTYYAAHRDTSNAARKAWYTANPERSKATMKAWRENNPEKQKALDMKRASDPDARWMQLVRAAKYRGKSIDLDQHVLMKKKMTDPCFYCGFHAPEGHCLNGIDRIDSNGGYTLDNIVAACAVCNYMKRCKTISAFVSHTRRIVCDVAIGPPVSIPLILRRTATARTETKKPVNYLTIEEIMCIHKSKCTYCGLFPALGIDRIDSNEHYTSKNSVPCCTECNFAKYDMGIGDFLRHIGHIVYHTRYWVLQPSIPPLTMTRAAEWCYHAHVNGCHFLTIRQKHASIPAGIEWKKHPATDFDELFNKYMVQPVQNQQ